MTKNKKSETCLNKFFILFLAITTVICTMIGLAIYIKLDTLHKDLNLQADENKRIVLSVGSLHKRINKYESEIGKIKKATRNVWQIQRHPESNGLVIKQHEQGLEKVFGGIGVKFRKRANSFVVLEVFDGLPAQKAGLYEGDEIVKINGEQTARMDQREFVKTLRGPKGSTVNLSYKLSGSLDSIKEVKITRDTIDLNKINERE